MTSAIVKTDIEKMSLVAFWRNYTDTQGGEWTNGLTQFLVANQRIYR